MLKYEGLKKFAIQFLYADNKQLYDEEALLTYEEYIRIRVYLELLLNFDVILPASSEDPLCVDYILWETTDYDPITFDVLYERWEADYLLDAGKEFGIVL